MMKNTKSKSSNSIFINKKNALGSLVFTNRTIVMQRIMDAITNGFSCYCCGTVSQDRCAKLVSKFELNYQISADRNERARRKRSGLGNASIVLWLNNGVVRWWLFVTPKIAGDHAAHSIEKLREATSKNGRIEIDGFELVSLPKKAAPIDNDRNNDINKAKKREKDEAQAKKSPKKLSLRYQHKLAQLTWRMTERKNQAWRDSIIDAVRKSSNRSIEVLIYQLWSSPGFSGIRSQIGKLAALYRAEVKRASRKDVPVLPKKLGYVRRLKNQGVTLAQLSLQARQLANTPINPATPATKDLPISKPCFAASKVFDSASESGADFGFDS